MDGATGHWRKRGKSVPASPFVSALMHACMHHQHVRVAPYARVHHTTSPPTDPPRKTPPGQCRLGLLHSLIKLSCRPTTSSALRGRHGATHCWKPRRSPAVCCPIGGPNDPNFSPAGRDHGTAGNHDGALAFAGRGRSVDRIQLLVAGRPAAGIFSSTRCAPRVDSLPSRRRN
jgi:hypothetical protein